MTKLFRTKYQIAVPKNNQIRIIMYICIVIFQKKICISQDSKHDVSMWCDHIYVDGVKKIMIMEQTEIVYYAKTQNNCLFNWNVRLD